MAKSNRSSVYFDRKLRCFVGMDEALLKELKSLYPSVNVDAELLKMKHWIESPKGKLSKGTINFIINWLGKKAPAADFPSAEKQLEYIQSDTFLVKIIREYLEDLWKGREHLLSFNSQDSR
jgi:hypothetical protein